jgi:pimeloyl-ACP methyl ester carboxylesterase
MAAHIPGPLYYEQIGATGAPMLFLHSTPDDHRLWMYQTAHFSAWYRCIAIDLAGYGRSPAVQDGVTMEDQAAACWEIVDRITNGGIIIHANSMGASVTMRMVKQQPARIRALLLSGTGQTRGSDIFQKWVERYTAEGIGLRHIQVLDHFAPASLEKPLIQHYARMVVELNNVGTLASIIAMNKANAIRMPEDFYRGITAPTIIIMGQQDRTYESSLALHKLIPGSEHMTISDAAHAPMMEAPQDYDRLAIAFLKKHGLFPGAAA